LSLKDKAKILLHPIFEKFRKEYAVPHSLIIDDYEHDITNAVLKVLEDAQKEIDRLEKQIEKEIMIRCEYSEQIVELKQKLQQLRDFWVAHIEPVDLFKQHFTLRAFTKEEKLKIEELLKEV